MTLTEVLVTMVILGLVLSVFVFALILMYRTSAEKTQKLEMDISARDAINRIEQDGRYASSFMTTAPTDRFKDSFGEFDNIQSAYQWSHKGAANNSNKRVLLLKSYAISTNQYSTQRGHVFINAAGYNCGNELQLNPKLSYVTIYFVKAETLYRRVLVDNKTQTCWSAKPSERQSCPESAKGFWPKSCEVYDEVIANDVKAFKITYRTAAQSVISNAYTSSDPGVLNVAEYIDVDLVIGRTISGQLNTTTANIRVSKVNR